MTEPALAHATEYGRMYSRSLSEPPTVPSITTVIAQGSTSLDGWHSYMAASAVVKDPKLSAALGNPSALRGVVKDASSASERYRDAAAERGTRVHFYAEQVALRALDRAHELERAREDLASRGEHQFADRFDEWWKLYEVQPIAPEITVWNAEVGYAGTLDLVARIGGRLCLIDYKTKKTDRDGQVKPLDDKVVMQLVAGMKAQESLVDAGAGIWEPWAYGQEPLLLGVAVGQTEVRPMRANPAVLPQHWFKFCALRRVWQTSMDAIGAGRALLPVPPPPVGAHAAPAPEAPIQPSAVPAGGGAN
ncbi:PD-(D/E)XK nuclease family protein [Arthrobacter sp. zg-Y40]|uniref:PD-(D/E)XK nuclease family protein n=1 Tax=Arthrobacter sp. zg-Y40 TaxID=2886939 RepID=UPI001D14C430|nr:PD-(D/E)XK nuclease family protein [Arthrobacter sp. zg-Y40]MCC3279523.1 PD-(D/E)XK nuclease family protein [Arthrobacter sp. zg-Y40]